MLQKRRAKAKLFRQVVPGGVAVVNADDPNAEILGGVNLDARRVAFALEPVAASGAASRRLGPARSGSTARGRGWSCTASTARRPCTCPWSARGRRLVRWRRRPWPGPWRSTAAAVVAGLEAVRAVAGHLETVVEGQDFDVRIDAAATPSALAEALAASRAIGAGTGALRLERRRGRRPRRAPSAGRDR